MHDSTKALVTKGWTVVARPKHRFALPSDLANRYRTLPDEVLAILSGIDCCIAPDEKAWLNCQPEFDGTSDSEFKWNEFECMSLEAAEGDKDFEREIRAFWDSHIPVYMSVRDGYSYVAVCTKGDSVGKLFEGCEPEFEVAIQIADKLTEFLANL